MENGARRAGSPSARAFDAIHERSDADHRPAERPHVLIGWARDSHTDPIASALARTARVTWVDLARAGRDVSSVAEPPVDVAVLSAALLGAGMQWLLQDPAGGLPEPVFVVDDAWSPERLVLESAGFTYIVRRRDLASWLPSTVPQLCALARTRRLALKAAMNRPPPPRAPIAAALPRDLPLHAAETRFRETYLRLLLAEHGSRRLAAEHARVPYRSFCGMLRKLGI